MNYITKVQDSSYMHARMHGAMASSLITAVSSLGLIRRSTKSRSGTSGATAGSRQSALKKAWSTTTPFRTALCTSEGRGACAATSVLQGSCGRTLAWAIYPGLMLVFFGIICGGPSHGGIQGGMSKLHGFTVLCILQLHCKMNN